MPPSKIKFPISPISSVPISISYQFLSVPISSYQFSYQFLSVSYAPQQNQISYQLSVPISKFPISQFLSVNQISYQSMAMSTPPSKR